jgi:stage II sporulation protein AB (anti-sigma F factor)
MNNQMRLQFAARSENESFARVTVAAFVAQMDPTLEELNDIKTVVSEAVTNAIIHGYEHDPNGQVTVSAEIEGMIVTVLIEDEGKGIEDLEQARQPMFTTKPDMERSGMGFTIMESFMDTIEIHSVPGSGTSIVMRKTLLPQASTLN